jgi:hypothetical protein
MTSVTLPSLLDAGGDRFVSYNFPLTLTQSAVNDMWYGTFLDVSTNNHNGCDVKDITAIACSGQLSDSGFVLVFFFYSHLTQRNQRHFNSHTLMSGQWSLAPTYHSQL